MMYLIGALAPWLLIAAGFAALAGWAFAAERGAPAQVAQRRERDKLVRDLAQLAAGEATPQTAIVSDADTARSLANIRDGRIAELERALDQARSRAAGLAGEVAEYQRRADRHDLDSAELARLREQAAVHEARAAQTIDAHIEPLLPTPIEPPEEETNALQMWRLRYFEQRVKFLEDRAPAAPAPENAPTLEWRVRDAETRAQVLEQELRRRDSAEAGKDEGSPFAASADVDALLRWRMLYLERRAAHWRQAAAKPALAEAPVETAPQEATPDPDRWRWRARYLESRVRHLEQGASAPAMEPIHTNGAEAETPPPPPLVPAGSEERPPALPAATAGAPDDFTLIDGVSPLQQSTLYSLGIYHFDQIAAWTPANVAWVDKYLRLRGRIGEEEWVEQAGELAQFGVHSARGQGEGARA